MDDLFNKFTDVSTISEADGHYIAGFVDGEGCFQAWTEQRQRKRLTASFTITLRFDDKPILDWIKGLLECGYVYEHKRAYGKNPHPCVTYIVKDAASLWNVIVPLFERFPLRAKKRRDFRLWKQAVLMIVKIKRRRRVSLGGRGGWTAQWSSLERAEFDEICKSIKAGRIPTREELRL